MSPKYALVLLLALVFAATSFANYPKPPHKGKPPTDQELSLEEQENSQVNAKPSSHKPQATLQNELSVTEKPIPKKKPPHDGPGHHPAVEENVGEEKNYKPPHRKKPPPHEPGQYPAVEENVGEEKNYTPKPKPKPKPPGGHGHPAVEETVEEEKNLPPKKKRPPIHT